MDERSYAIAQQKSYAGQETSFAFSAKEGINEVPLGFQPLGISIRDGVMAISAYFEPAIMLADVQVLPNMLNLFNIRWIRGTVYNGSSVRMFPDIFQPGGANRMQSVIIRSKEHLQYTRNGDRRIYSIRLRADGRWHHEHESEMVVPDGKYQQLHSILLDGNCLIATESDDQLENWVFCAHMVSAQSLKLDSCRSITTWRYLGAYGANGYLYSMADVRAKSDKGIFVNSKQLALDVAGNGIALLDDGKAGALVTRYGQAYPGPFNGIPGALIYVPPQFLK